MNRHQLKSRLRKIFKNLDNSIHLETTRDAGKSEARHSLELIKQEIIMRNEGKLLAYFYGFLVDGDAFSANTATLGFLGAYAEELIKTVPALNIHLAKLRQMPDRLLQYVLSFYCGSHVAAMVKSSKVTPKESWCDPITCMVMNYPVSYFIEDKEHTLDLFTLLKNSERSFGIRCPLSRQYIYPNDLRPRLDIVMEIIGTIKGEIKCALNNHDEFLQAVEFINNNDLPGLEAMYSSTYRMNLNLKDNEDTLFHHACRENRFEIAIWLLNHEAFPPNYVSAINLLNKDLLDQEILRNPGNAGLYFLRGFCEFNRPETILADTQQCLRDLERAVEMKFIPALFFRGIDLCLGDHPTMVWQGVGMLREAVRANWASAGLALYRIFTAVICTKPELKAVVESENLRVSMATASASRGAHVVNIVIDNDNYALNAKSIIRDCLMILGSEENLVGRSALEARVAEVIYDEEKSNTKPLGYNKMLALCLASRSQKAASEDRELLIKILTSLGLHEKGLEIISKIETTGRGRLFDAELINRFFDMGILKPWFPFKPQFTSVPRPWV